MFEPETEDMLPRSAPRPSAAVPIGHTNEIIRPTVPEVSILFGQPPQQQEPLMQMQMQTAQEQAPRPEPTFASWKKQMLPRVNFSPILTTELGPRPAPTSCMNNNLVASSNEYVVIPRDRHYANEVAPCASSSVGMYSESKKHQFQQARRLSAPSNSDVLTICAGTQTDAVNLTSPRTSLPSVVYSDIDVSNLVNKNDLATVVSLLETMRQEQQQLRRLCETLLKEQQAKVEAVSKPSRATASQCDILTSSNNNNHGKRITPTVQDYIVEEEEPPARVIPQQFQSPRPTPPMAQSTGYRANTPQGTAKRIPQLAKPNTEKSMVMNELALKYLRQPVDELMKDMRLGASPKSPNNAEPLRQIDNLTHTPVQSSSPNDISNASYKYLKKYRLLPEEQLDYARSPQSPLAAPPQMQLDLENIRNQPKLM
ncbi:uncharacterized protein LOC110178248 [Drosophila serrata]|uniref:uncharacterized protein LOC110178248 n=1 Tax=Drosophila serrata TaxID=7274 RepID=UPI000A1D3136|nr:uncharacterized protein LOC110178248 [Drosophila serrata]KAH8389027.1 hypothetical protein KR200_009780 [Drosophila serrata]